MDSCRLDIAAEARDFLVDLHLQLSDDLRQQQAVVRSSLIKCAAFSILTSTSFNCCKQRLCTSCPAGEMCVQYRKRCQCGLLSMCIYMHT